jgi:two-component system, NarL family, sensor histidine kinase FusK
MTVRQNILWTASVFLLYLASAKLGLKYAVIGHTVTLLWPPSGVALAATLIGGYRLWPGIALGAFIANVETGVPFLTLAIITLGNTMEPLCGALLLRRQNNFSVKLDKVSDVFALVLLAAFISTILGASLGTLGLFVGGKIAVADLWPTWIAWWLGDGMGVLVISPVLLIGSSVVRSLPLLFSLTKTLEVLVLIVALTVIGQIIFGDLALAGPGHFQVSLSMFPFAIWSALRFGSIGAAGVTLIASLLAINGTVQGTGPFALHKEMDSLILWCLFADIMAITGLLLAAVNSGREKALLALKGSNENLERQVQKRTDELRRINMELHTALTERRRMQMEMDQISEERQKMIGQELHDGLGQQLTGIAFLVSSLHETLGAKSAPETLIARQIKDLLAEAMSVVRSLSHGLYPVVLENSNFPSALRHLAEFAQSASDVQCSVRCTTAANLIDRNIALNLYRIAQESVCNALRHSEAERIKIKLSVVDEQYLLSVEDNGRGVSDQNMKASATLGLRSMHCRADLIGAAIEVYENPSGGTTIVVTGPMKREG